MIRTVDNPDHSREVAARWNVAMDGLLKITCKLDT